MSGEETLYQTLTATCREVSVTEFRSRYAVDFRLPNEGTGNFASSMDVSKDLQTVSELIIRFTPTRHSERDMQAELDRVVAASRAPPGTTARVQPRSDGTVAPHIVLSEVSFEAVLAYLRRLVAELPLVDA